MKRNLKNFSLNGAGTSLTTSLGTAIIGDDGLDKRSSGGSARQTASNVINTLNAVSDTISNALGNRNPYYIIGEISNDTEDWYEKYLGGVGSAIRAVSKLIKGNSQEGVIIDCLGDVDGESSVEFTQNPVMYVTNGVTDSRLRKPYSVSAVVAVSNYLSDSVMDQVVGSTLGAFEVTGGLLSQVNNALFYGGNTRAQYALYRLRWLMENGVPFTLHTPHGIYENMLIKSIKPRTDDAKMDMLYATIDFEEIIMYTTYKQTIDGKETPIMPARTSITEGESTLGTGISGAKTLYNKVSSIF